MKAIKTVDNFFPKLTSELDKIYFPDVKYYRDNQDTTDIHYTVELFNNGCITYNRLISRLVKSCKDTSLSIELIVDKYLKWGK